MTPFVLLLPFAAYGQVGFDLNPITNSCKTPGRYPLDFVGCGVLAPGGAATFSCTATNVRVPVPNNSVTMRNVPMGKFPIPVGFACIVHDCKFPAWLDHAGQATMTCMNGATKEELTVELRGYGQPGMKEAAGLKFDAELGRDLIAIGKDIAAMIIGDQNHKSVLDQLDSISSEIHQALQNQQEILNEMKLFKKDMKDLQHFLAIRVLDDAYITITSAWSSLETIGFNSSSDVDELNRAAKEITSVNSAVQDARMTYFTALNGTLPSLSPQTLPEAVFNMEGYIPRTWMQQLMRTLGLAQTLISWAYMQLGKDYLATRDKDADMWAKRFDDMWLLNFDRVFAIGQCTWSKSDLHGPALELSCGAAADEAAPSKKQELTRPARVVTYKRDGLTYDYNVGAKFTKCLPGDDPHVVSLPTRGSYHDDWGFDLKCESGVTGIVGASNVPDGAYVSYVAGFKLKCREGGFTPKTTHWINSTDDQIEWNLDFGSEALQIVEGCTNFPNGHYTTYWSSATFYAIGGRSKSIQTKGEPCGSDATYYHIGCPPGYCMNRFQGFSDIPDGNHVVSYIACLNIYCKVCTASAGKVVE